ncbi:MAG: cytochrome-c peroxidase, partial [Planctomycetes bacterium]|nr:cytochrome-c peroxidase [Planctomycetota bacterium]
MPVLLAATALPLSWGLGACTSKEVSAAKDAAAHSLSFDVLPLGLAAVPMTKPATFTEAKAALGKELFFDKRLSSNGAMSCESCHMHDKAWTDGIRFSTKVDGSKNTRNSPTLYNVGYHEKLYWDGRAPSLEANIAAAWKGHMGGAEAVVTALNKVKGYQSDIQKAFGGPATMDNVPEALAHFVRTLRAGNSAADRQKLDADAKAGQALFMGKAKCVVCHTPPLFVDRNFQSVGLRPD